MHVNHSGYHHAYSAAKAAMNVDTYNIHSHAHTHKHTTHYHLLFTLTHAHTHTHTTHRHHMNVNPSSLNEKPNSPNHSLPSHRHQTPPRCPACPRASWPIRRAEDGKRSHNQPLISLCFRDAFPRGRHRCVCVCVFSRDGAEEKKSSEKGEREMKTTKNTLGCSGCAG